MKYDVLIVEDDKTLAGSWQKALTREGYRADVAADGEAGWRCWEQQPYDAILLDIKMPRLSGSDLLARIRASQPLVPVVIVSGEGTDEDKRRAVNEHAFAYLEKKDVTLDAVLATLKRALGERDLMLRYLESLVDNSPDPDRPLLVVGDTMYSPRQLYDHARKGTPFGRTYLAELSATVVEMSTLTGAGTGEDDDFVAGGVI